MIYRGTAGNGASTIVDVNKGSTGVAPTTIYTTQANRPTVAFGEGNYVSKVATAPDVTAFNAYDFFTIDVDAVEGGNPNDLVIGVSIVYD